MPTTGAILEVISRSAHDLAWLALAWHVAVLLLACGLVAGWRPATWFAHVLLVAPVATVAVASLAYGSWFNGASFAVLAVLLAVWSRELALPLRATRSRPQFWIGVALIAFALTYAHFTSGWNAALWLAPVGVVPCPTLALVAGFALLADGFHSRKISEVLVGWTAFYALFGIFRLGVWLDVGLIVAALALAALAWRTLGSPTAHGRRLSAPAARPQ